MSEKNEDKKGAKEYSFFGQIFAAIWVGGWLVVLYEHEKRSRIEEGMKHYKAAGLTVYMQKTDG